MQITIKWRFIVGIDISKKQLAIHLVDRKTGHGVACHVPNNRKGFMRLGQWLESQQAKSQTKLISEHTGRYGEHLLQWSTEAGWSKL